MRPRSPRRARRLSATATLLSRLPASSLGLTPVSSVMFMHTWNRHRCTAVSGHRSRKALSRPPPPSHTTASGGAILDIRHDHAAPVSRLATYQPITCPPAIVISTTACRCRWMPSRCTKSCTWSGQRDRRPQPPHQLVATPERACGHGTLLLRVLRQQPRQRRPEVRGPPVVRARARRPRTTGPCTATGSFPTMWSRSSSSDHGTRDIRERSCHSGNHIRTPPHPYARNAPRHRTDTQSGRPRNPDPDTFDQPETQQDKTARTITDTQTGL